MNSKKELEKYQIAELKKILADNYIEKKKHEEFLLKKDIKISKLKDELEKQKEKLFDLHLKKKRVEAELEYYQKHHVFMENNLFKDYIFGDNLPSIKLLYDYLFENELLEDCTWGYFCNALEKGNTFSIKILIPTAKEIGNETIGFILYKIGQFCKMSRGETIELFVDKFTIISAQKNQWSVNQFNKYINPYNRVEKHPPNYHEIDRLFNKMDSFCNE